MKLNERDKMLLRSLGYDDKDFWQIEEATRQAVFTHNRQRISCKTARILLGQKAFLAGVARSAFHSTAMQDALDGSAVYFYVNFKEDV